MQKRVRRIFLSCLVLFLGMYILLEGSSWFLIKYYFLPRGKITLIEKDKIEKRIDNFAKGDSKGEFDPVLGWEMRPFDAQRYIDWSYHIDNKGARLNKTYEKTRKISTYGDSFTFCDQVCDDETWQYYLSDMTKSNVVNFGVGGYGTDQAVLRLEKSFEENKTDVVVLGILTENLARNINRYRATYLPGGWGPTKPMFFPSEGKKYVLLENPIKKRDDIYKLKYDQFFIEICKEYDFWFPYYQSFPKFKFPFFLALAKSVFRSEKRPSHAQIVNNDRAIETTKYIVKRFTDVSKQKSFFPIVVLFPAYSDLKNYYENDINNFRRLKNILNFEELVIIDVLEAFREQLIKNKIKITNLYRNFRHISPQGNLIVAKAIYDVLRDRSILN